MYRTGVRGRGTGLFPTLPRSDHVERPHSARGGVPLTVAVETERKDGDDTTDDAMSNTDDPTILKFPPGKVKCSERLGGLLKHYYRDAA